MLTSAAFKQGLRITRKNGTAVRILFIVNLGLAALAALPIYHGILDFTGHSFMSRTLAEGFSMDWLTDFRFNNKGALERYANVIWWFGLVSMPVNAVLAGGAIAGLRDRSSLAGFFRASGRYAARLLRLMTLGLICYWIIFRLLGQGVGHLIDKWTHDWRTDRPVFWVQLAAGVVLLAGIGLVNLVMDYARVRLVMDDGSSAIEAFLASFGFALSRLAQAILVYAVPSLCGLALLGIYRLVTPWSAINAHIGSSHSAHWVEPLTLALLFLGQQVVMFGRYWFRVATWASEWSYYAASRGSTRP